MTACRPALRLCVVALLAVAAAAPAGAAGPLRAHVFSTVDRQAVGVGETLELRVEVLAAPASEAARTALVEAFAALDVEGQLGAAFEVVRSSRSRERGAGGVETLTRRLVLRVRSGAVREVPALRLAVPVGGRTWTFATRPHEVRTFPASDRVEAASRSVVPIVARGEVGGAGFMRIGSGFLIGDDALVTAYHVVVGAREVEVELPDGRRVRLSGAWMLDPTRDVALLHLDAAAAREAGLRPLVVAPPTADGGVAFTAGWPDRQQVRTAALRYDDLVLDGQRLRVAANGVRPGDSGGPLLDAEGRVLGVVVSGRSADGLPDLLQFSICLAANPGPAIARYREARAPVPLRAALDHAARGVPAGRAHEAVSAIQIPSRAPRRSRAPHVASLLDALRDAPDDPVLHYLAGTALEEVGEPRLAAGAFDAARRAGHAPAGYSLAHHLLRRGRYRVAADLFAEASRSGVYYRLGAFGQAQALVALGQHTEAERALEVVLDHDSRFAPALYLLGLVRIAQGREAEAAALVVRLADRPAWADALRVPLEAPGLRSPALQPLPRVAVARGAGPG